jgi:RNA polymerase sigma factor (sigma-70 family)
LPDVLADRTVLDLRTTPIESVAGAAALLRAALGILPGDWNGRGGEGSASPDELHDDLARVRRILGDSNPDVVQAESALRAVMPAAPSDDVVNRLTTAELLDAIGAGDQAAWAQLFSRYRGRVEGVVRSFRLREADGDDAIQRTWLRLVEHHRAIRDPEHLEGWLAVTARRECLAIMRADGRETSADLVDVGDSANLEQLVLDRDEVRRLDAAIALLSPRSRVLVEALLVDRPRSYHEVSQAIGLPVGSIGPTRARLLRQLRRQLDPIDTLGPHETGRDSRVNATAATIAAIVDDASESA